MATIVGVLFVAALVFSFFGSLVWIYRDAESRSKPGLLVACLAALIAWPVSLLVWIALRPPVQTPRGQSGGRRPFNLQDFRQQ